LKNILGKIELQFIHEIKDFTVTVLGPISITITKISTHEGTISS
jgi:hypothetical protein